ncbi:MAG: hypothetical protein ACRD88_01120 [Terriglobia bacterium]
MLVVSFMPYFPDDQVNRVYAGYRIWNWRRFREQLVPDAPTRAYLDRYFGLFVLPNGDPERRIAIVSQEGQPIFPQQGDLQQKEIGRFAGAVMASYLFNFPAEQSAGWMACSSDNFVAFFQPFDATAVPAATAFEYGSYVRIRVLGSWDHLRFTTPQHMPDPRPCFCDEEILNRLATLSVEQNELVERIFRSLDWVRLAFANYEGFQYPARIVAMATAFEILLDFRDVGKAQHFSKEVNLLLPPNRLPTTTQPWGAKARPLSDNDIGWWCRSFYSLRSRIVHGEELQPGDFQHGSGTEHLRIALNIFAECIQGLLIGMGRMQEEKRRQRFWFRRTWIDQLGLPDDVWYP